MLIFYWVVGKKLRNLFLLLASLIFYAFEGPQYVAVILLSIGINYCFGLLVERSRQVGSAKTILYISVIVNLFILLYSKRIIIAFARLGNVQLGSVHAAVGVSFFTFAALAYLFDIYWKKTRAQRNPIDFGLFMALFPKLTAGPIVRYCDLEKDLNAPTFSSNDFAYGVKRFIIGLGKKVLLADTLAKTVGQIMAIPYEHLTTELAWLGIIAYTLEIYLDFSGYSDMAIGLGRMLGYHFLENFNYPYISKSITEFWRRWHISLSSWFKDYLYIPLGGNRCSPSRTYMNLFVVFLLCGLWHGRAWNFLIWGMFHGLFMILERGKFGELLKKTPVFIQHGYALFIIVFSWVFFTVASIPSAISFLKALLGAAPGRGIAYNSAMFFNAELFLALTIGALSSTPVLEFCKQYVEKIKRNDVISAKVMSSVLSFSEVSALSAVFLLSIISLASFTYNPFIYFQF